MRKIKIRLLGFILSLLALSISLAQAANLQFKSITDGYMVTGVINQNDLQWRDYANFWAPMHTKVHETGSYYYQLQDNKTYCSKSKQYSVDVINNKLRQGIAVTTLAYFEDNGKPWTAEIDCKVDYSPDAGGWIVTTMTPSLPSGAKCDTSVPLKVGFGTLAVGTANITTVMDGTIKCDKDTDVSLSFRGFDDGYIPVQDATVKFSFDNGSPTYKLTTKKNVTSNFKINFEAISTGTATGYKSASAVLVMQWE